MVASRQKANVPIANNTENTTTEANKIRKNASPASLSFAEMTIPKMIATIIPTAILAITSSPVDIMYIHASF